MKFLPQVFPIASFGDGGFRFGSHSHLGSLLILPSGMRAWDASEIILYTDFSTVLAEKENFDVLILGMGKTMYRPSHDVMQFFAKHNVNLDFMSTSSAVHNYNVMLAESRRVAACLVAVA
jgi:uncharacterized protein